MNRINTIEQHMTAWELATRYEHDEIIVPACQRLWSWTGKRGLKKMQCLIDSAMNGFPIPSIILNRIDHRTFEVYDGQHRIRTFNKYMQGEFKWDGRTYDELSEEEKRRFDNRQIPVTVTVRATVEQLGDIFMRLNAGQPLTDSDKLWARRGSPLVDATIRHVLNSERLSAALGGIDLKNRSDLSNWVALVAGIATGNAGNITTSFVRLADLLDTVADYDYAVPTMINGLCDVLEAANEGSPATNTEKKRLKKVGRLAAFFLAEYMASGGASQEVKAKWVEVIRRLRGNEKERADMTAALTTTGAQNLTARKIEQVLEQVNRLLAGGAVSEVDVLEDDSE